MSKELQTSLVLGSTASHIEGMNLREGWALLTRLRDWATQPQFVYRHEWTVGDMVIWDNSGTVHRATPYPLESGRMTQSTGHGRRMCKARVRDRLDDDVYHLELRIDRGDQPSRFVDGPRRRIAAVDR